MAAAAGALAGAFLGVMYAFSFYYVPYVYLNFLFALAFGAGTGYVVGIAAREGKIRNVAAVSGLALGAAAVGIYVEWAACIYALVPLADMPALWSKLGLAALWPPIVAGLMADLFREGSWGLSEGVMVRGWPLVALWVVEASCIALAAVKTATQQIAKLPFCESCQEWVAGRTPHLYFGEGSEPVWTHVKQGVFETLAMTPRATGQEPTYVRLILSACPNCSESNFLTVTACRNTVDAKGNPKLEEQELASNLILAAHQADIVEAAHRIAPGADGMLPALPGAGPGGLAGGAAHSAQPAELQPAGPAT
jgi:hypothetical protein